MKALLLLASASLITLLNAGHVQHEKNIHVVSSHPIYETRNMHSKHHNRHYERRDHRHIVGYRNIAYYKGMKIVKESRERLRRIPIEIIIRF